jgi:Ulp1 family protease
MVMKKTVDTNGHVWSFLSHRKIFVPVHKHEHYWVLFVVCPADQHITIIGSLCDQGPWHVKMFDNIVKIIHDYEQSKEIPKDKWAWHMHAVVVDQQLNLDDFGVCTGFWQYIALSMYWIIVQCLHCCLPIKHK